MDKIHDLIIAPKYNFLRENEHLNQYVMFVTFGGSYAYGIPMEYSDVDIRGCSVGTKSDILGMSTFSQYTDKQTDTTVYSFFKTVSKIVAGDIRMLELLGCEPEQYAMVSPLGQQFLDHQSLFLTKRAASSYQGYVLALKDALNTAGSRMSIGKQVYEKSLLAQCNNAVAKFNRLHPETVKAYIGQSDKDKLCVETFLDIQIEHCPVRDFDNLLNATRNIVTSMEQAAAGRNYIDKYWVSKKLAEILRALYTCCELLETGKLKTYRKEERELLLSVRNGEFLSPKLEIKQEFNDILLPLQERLDYAMKHTQLPEEPDMKQIDEFVMHINKQALES